MNELYERIAGCNPNRRTMILTVLDGETAGEKALYADGCLQWTSQTPATSFRRSARPASIRLKADRYTVNFPAVNRSWSSAAADMFPFP